MAAYLEDILSGVYRLGARGVLVLNAHDGNIRPVQTAGDRLWERFPDRFLLLVNWWETLASAEMEAMGLFTQDGGHGHGGPLEMSAADAARPGTVDWGAARDLDVIFSPGERIVRGVNEGRPLPNWEGYHGRATEGSLAKGEQLLQIAVERITQLTRLAGGTGVELRCGRRNHRCLHGLGNSPTMSNSDPYLSNKYVAMRRTGPPRRGISGRYSPICWAPLDDSGPPGACAGRRPWHVATCAVAPARRGIPVLGVDVAETALSTGGRRKAGAAPAEVGGLVEFRLGDALHPSELRRVVWGGGRQRFPAPLWRSSRAQFAQELAAVLPAWAAAYYMLGFAISPSFLRRTKAGARRVSCARRCLPLIVGGGVLTVHRARFCGARQAHSRRGTAIAACAPASAQGPKDMPP